ncbi:MAG TPA: APC family permease [Terriglobia bacterium]|nr:APC family permease [Terriglobia bacterium]
MNKSISQTEVYPDSTIPRLRRVLSLWDLILYGIVAVTPSAPVTVFGLALVMSRGHALDTILIAMVAMVLTAFSYGRMAALYPSAGSAYTYVGRGLNPHLGFLAGWAMLLDYLFIPLFCVIYGTLAFQRLLPQVPYIVFAAFFAGIMTYLNLRGIKATARTSEILVGAMGLVLLTFIALAVRYMLFHQGWKSLFTIRPFYNPSTFEFHSIATATSFAALTYLGFDSVTTLAEDVKNPRRNVLLAVVLVCAFTGIFGGLLVYLAQLVWPDYQTFSNVETAFMDVTRRVGGVALFQAMAILLVVANIGAGLTSQVGAARLLFGMGRDNVFPRKIFAYLDPKHNTPTINIWIIGLVAFFGSLVMSYELTAEILNFGAFLGFMGVNVATVWQFYVVKQQGRKKRFLADLVVPGLGFLFCLWIWWNLAWPAKIAGGTWFVLGIIHLAAQTRGFRKTPVLINFSES